jgi:RNA methyltransferase, TrmH family
LKPELITSLQNKRIKNFLKLQKVSERRKQQLFIIEGKREFRLAREAGYQFEQIYYCPDFHSVPTDTADAKLFEISKSIYAKVAYRDSTEGIIALAKPMEQKLSDLNLSANPVIIVLEGVEKPGNLGAVLRTADAAGVDAVVVCDERTDLYNPNTVRSSIGCLFTVQTAVCTNYEALEFFSSQKIQSFAAELEASEFYHKTDLSGPLAIVMGTESTGLSDFWIKNSGRRIKIPMQGAIDSLNVSNATAVLVYEAMRQRNFSRLPK